MWRNADPSSKELREESKNPHVKEYGEQQTRQDLTCEEMCRKPDTVLENIWKEKGQCVLKCGEKQAQPLKYVEKGRYLVLTPDIWRKEGLYKIKVLLVGLCIDR